MRYYLTSGCEFGSPAPDWWSVEDSEDRAWRAIGTVGCGPDFVIVPNTATSGTYCLCTLARDEAGALLTIGK